jgi:hypothetical protein
LCPRPSQEPLAPVISSHQPTEDSPLRLNFEERRNRRNNLAPNQQQIPIGHLQKLFDGCLVYRLGHTRRGIAGRQSTKAFPQDRIGWRPVPGSSEFVWAHLSERSAKFCGISFREFAAESVRGLPHRPPVCFAPLLRRLVRKSGTNIFTLMR